jgi:hypothetical protein
MRNDLGTNDVELGDKRAHEIILSVKPLIQVNVEILSTA